MVRFRRQRQVPPELEAEAARFPNGYVYEIDPRFDRDGPVPPHAVKGAWAVDARGKLTGEYEANPAFGIRVPLAEVAQILADLKANAGDSVLEVFVGNELTLEGELVSFDVGIAIVMQAALGQGYFPSVEPWMEEIEGGRRYVLHRSGANGA